MTKKVIALMAVVTIVFVCTFAACDKGTYTNPATGTKYDLVTDENGEKVLADDGELLVYATDENGKYVTNESGELETQKQAFIGQIEENGVVEDYAYYLTLPDGWKVTDESGVFENKSKSQTIEIDIVESTYEDYIEKCKEIYKILLNSEAGVTNCTWEDGISFVDGIDKGFVVTYELDDSVIASVVFVDSGNVYNITFTDEGDKNIEQAKADCIAVCQGLTFKPYTYYPDVTAKSSEE